MKTHQNTILLVAAANLAVVLLFPPHDSLSMWRGGTPTFDAFYFVFSPQFNKQTNGNLLTLEVLWVLINASLGWLLARNYRPGQGLMSARAAALAFMAANLALMLLFPPFENYASTTRMSGTWFDGFYFLFGDKWNRRFFLPLLYLEVLWVLVNAAVLWLVLRDPPEPEAEPEES